MEVAKGCGAWLSCDEDKRLGRYRDLGSALLLSRPGFITLQSTVRWVL